MIVGPYIENFEYEIRRMELIEILYIETTTLSLVEKLSTILGGGDRTVDFKTKCEEFISSEQGGLQKNIKVPWLFNLILSHLQSIGSDIISLKESVPT